MRLPLHYNKRSKSPLPNIIHNSMNNTVTRVTHESYASRVGNSFKGVLLGPILLISAIILLVWNESQAVTAQRSLSEGLRTVISIPTASSLDVSLAGKLVHVVGRAETDQELLDATFGVKATSTNHVLKLKRTVEMYQWVEHSSSRTEKNTGGSTTTTTTYSYQQEWKPSLINSGSFQDTQYQNPSSMPYQEAVYVADQVRLGAFTLSANIVNRMTWFTDYSIENTITLDNIPDEALRSKSKVIKNGFYIGENPSTPAVGDIKITYQVVQPQTISIVAAQVGDSFAPYPTQAGQPILLVEHGPHTAAEMFQNAQSAAAVWVWIMRVVGFALMYAGLQSMVQPLSVLADVIPCLGDLVGTVTSCVVCPVAFVLSSTIIAMAWIAYRPFLAIPFLILLVGSVSYQIRNRVRRAASSKLADTIPHAQLVEEFTPGGVEYAPKYKDFRKRSKADDDDDKYTA